MLVATASSMSDNCLRLCFLGVGMGVMKSAGRREGIIFCGG